MELKLPVKAIVKEDVFSYLKKSHQYAKKHEVVMITDAHEHVVTAVKENGDWFPININKLLIQN